MSRLSSADATALGIAPQFRYATLIDQIIAGQGEFVPIKLTDLRGRYRAAKQSCLLQAARKRNVPITTTCRAGGGVCYARLILDQTPSGEVTQ